MDIEVKKFTTNCENNTGGSSPVTLYIGHPFKDSHPLAFQNRWLSNRGISIPENVMESFSKLMEISEKNNLPFIDLVDYVIKEVELGKSLREDSKKATEISKNTDKELKESSKQINLEDSQNDKNNPIENQKLNNSSGEIDETKSDKLVDTEVNKSSDQALEADNKESTIKEFQEESKIEENKIDDNQKSPSLFKKISDKK